MFVVGICRFNSVWFRFRYFLDVLTFDVRFSIYNQYNNMLHIYR